jgi:hypothetical protein
LYDYWQLWLEESMDLLLVEMRETLTQDLNPKTGLELTGNLGTTEQEFTLVLILQYL